MELFRLLLRASRRTLWISAAGGLIAGVSTSLLLAQVDASIARPHAASWRAFAVLCAVSVAARAVAEIWMLRGIMDMVFDLRVRLCRQILASPLPNLEAHGAAALLAAATEDITSISHGLPIVGLVITDALVVAICMAYLAWLSPLGATALIAMIAVGVLIGWRPLRRGRQLDTVARGAQNTLFDYLHMLVQGGKQLKLHQAGQIAFIDQALQPSAWQVRDRTVRARAWFSVTDATGHALFFAILGVWLVVAPSVATGDAAIMTTPVIILLYLFMPLKRTLEHLPLLSQATVALHKVTELGMALDPAADALPGDHDTARSFTVVDMAKVTYRRQASPGSQRSGDREFCLGPVDLSFRPGQVMFLIGGNGSGKSTLARVLTGLYPPSTGLLSVDGQPVTDATRESYRQLFSVVFADHHLFPDLHRDDPRLDAAARRYMTRFGLDRKVAIRDGRFSTIELSSGQRKRLALIAALVEDRPFYVLDEWAAEQEPLFKDWFYTELLPMLRQRGKCVVVITHDDQYFHIADVICKLENGQLSYVRPRPPVAAARAELVDADTK